MVFDVASNTLGNGIGAVIISPEGFHTHFISKLCFNCTNIMAEYEVCILGLKASINDKKFLRRFSAKLFLRNRTLYKRNHDSTLLRFVGKKEAENIMEDMHDGLFGTHSSGHTMTKKILRAGYYWSTMETDCHIT